MNTDEIKDRIRSTIRELLPEVPADEVTDSADIFELGLDSVHAMSLVTALQEGFDLELNDDEIDIANFESVEAIARLIGGKLAQPE